jgi:hypothetical protein
MIGIASLGAIAGFCLPAISRFVAERHARHHQRILRTTVTRVTRASPNG